MKKLFFHLVSFREISPQLHMPITIVFVVTMLVSSCSPEKKPAVQEDFGQTEEVKVDAKQAERIKRGDYLVNHVAVCINCHSDRDWNVLNAPIVPGTNGKGGQAFGPDFHLPGTFYARNITPYGINRYSDADLFKVLTTGENKEGEILYPWMPYQRYARMDEEDVWSIIAYIRTLVPVTHDVPKRKLATPLTLKAVQPVFTKRPPVSDQVSYGQYLVNAANCIDCHSKVNDKGEKLKGMEYAGGFEFHLPTGGVVQSANLTPDPDTGIGTWTRESFIARFKVNLQPQLQNVVVLSGEFNTYMPWSYLAGMTDEDLGAIYEYLKTLKPVKNTVVKFTPPPKKQ